MPSPEHALVFVPANLHDPADFAAVAAPCLERVETCGYVFAGIVRTWPDALALLMEGHADLMVVASRGHLPHDRHPRIEAATDPVRQPAQCVVPAELTRHQARRPRLIR